MAPLRIVVFEHCPPQPFLVGQLRALDAHCVLETPDAEVVFHLCRMLPVDLVMCHLPGEIEHLRWLLHNLSRMPDHPALAFYGQDADLGYLEYLCLRVGLCYLGFFAVPFNVIRVKRMFDQARLLSQGVAP